MIPQIYVPCPRCGAQVLIVPGDSMRKVNGTLTLVCPYCRFGVKR